MEEKAVVKSSNFIRNIIDEHLETGKHQKIITRFPPEPNGYLHIGHAKSICLNFGIARDYQGTCHLRFDDTNPAKEDQEYIDSIQEDVKWLGFDWGENLYFSSDYFHKLYDFAVELIKNGHAFVCELSPEEIREHRGTLKEPGKPSPHRDRSVEENLALFEKMKAGEFEEGNICLRAKIDMSSPNINMRDPVIYRVKKAHHHRTGNEWCIYPMYDFTHGLSDMLENITHSICTLEFEDHRPLYDWFLKVLKTPCHPQQIEFARLNLTYTVMSKRKLLQLVEEKRVSGWDDPRMPTISGMRRRGYPAAAIRDFCDRIGVTKKDTCIDILNLENCVREELNEISPRYMGVIDPLKVVITNYPEETEEFDCPIHPNKPEMGSRIVPFTKEIYIERDDFMEDAPKKFFRLAPGREVRLRYAYYITCQEVIKNDAGEIVELHCTYDPETRGGDSPDGRKVKGTIHWVSAKHGVPAELRMYERLFKTEMPSKEFIEDLNPDSLVINTKAIVEPSLKECPAGTHLQFERQGYFFTEPVDHSKDKLVFNRTVTLRDSWAKLQKK